VVDSLVLEPTCSEQNGFVLALWNTCRSMLVHRPESASLTVVKTCTLAVKIPSLPSCEKRTDQRNLHPAPPPCGSCRRRLPAAPFGVASSSAGHRQRSRGAARPGKMEHWIHMRALTLACSAPQGSRPPYYYRRQPWWILSLSISLISVRDQSHE
jgi:hypothetical protein